MADHDAEHPYVAALVHRLVLHGWCVRFDPGTRTVVADKQVAPGCDYSYRWLATSLASQRACFAEEMACRADEDAWRSMTAARDRQDDEIRQAAVLKLTPEERRLLGLVG